MASVKDSGTQAANVGSVHTLTTVTDVGVYGLVLDAGNLDYGDELELTVQTKVLSGGTTRDAYHGFYAHVQATPIKLSVPVPSDKEVVFTLKQAAGTGRSFPWKVMEL